MCELKDMDQENNRYSFISATKFYSTNFHSIVELIAIPILPGHSNRTPVQDISVHEPSSAEWGEGTQTGLCKTGMHEYTGVCLLPSSVLWNEANTGVYWERRDERK